VLWCLAVVDVHRHFEAEAHFGEFRLGPHSLLQKRYGLSFAIAVDAAGRDRLEGAGRLTSSQLLPVQVQTNQPRSNLLSAPAVRGSPAISAIAAHDFHEIVTRIAYQQSQCAAENIESAPVGAVHA
jgi:hypothetical protein